MARRWISISLVMVLSGCGRSPEPPANENRTAPVEVTDDAAASNNDQAPAQLPDGTTTVDPTTIKPGDAGGLPDDRTPVAEGKIDPKSAQGAGLVLQRYAGLLEQKKFAEARMLWSDGGKASGLTEKEFVNAYSKYRVIHSEIGAPGEMEGAAGSSYVEIPLRLYGTLNTGKPFNLVGTVALRRVNDVPGSSAEERQWHVYTSDLKPRP